MLVQRRKWKLRRILVLFAHDVRNPGDEIGMLLRDIGRLRRVVVEIVKFNMVVRLRILALGEEILAEALPIADAHALVANVGWELAVEERPWWLRLAKQGGQKTDAVHVLGRSRLCVGGFEQRWHPILEAAHALA